MEAVQKDQKARYLSYHIQTFALRKLTSSKLDTVLLDTFWEEMNRREAWDRTFEKRLRPVLNEIRLKDDDKEVLAGLMAERSQEEQRRKDWDAQHQKAQKP